MLYRRVLQQGVTPVSYATIDNGTCSSCPGVKEVGGFEEDEELVVVHPVTADN